MIAGFGFYELSWWGSLALLFLALALGFWIALAVAARRRLARGGRGASRPVALVTDLDAVGGVGRPGAA